MNSGKRSSGEELTGAVEDYLKAIYSLERDGPAATTVLATKLGVAPASVTAMLKRLADHGLATYSPYQGVTLSEDGRRATLKILRRHRIIEAYLVHALGYRWEEVHDEAERLEHAISNTLVERMARAIGDPVVDPHGAPIPSAEGVIDDRPLRSLADVPLEIRVTIARVSDEDSSMLRYLSGIGLTPGVGVCVQARAPFGGPITVRLDAGDERAIGMELAGKVLVE